jgi:hypothetical protein
MAFHVFVEGAVDGSPAGQARLAEAIHKEYGLDARTLTERLSRGRFRVKGNIDRATAETYVRALEKLGARCSIVEGEIPATGKAPVIKTPTNPPATAPAAPVARTETLMLGGQPLQPPAQGAKPATGPVPAVASSTSPLPLQSGLSAAFSGSSMPPADLGALGRDDTFSLASVDGADSSGPVSAAAFEPPLDTGLPASIGPAPAKTGPTPKPARPKDEPIDMFLPPEAQGEEFRVDIADEDFTRKRANTPPPDVALPVVRINAGPKQAAPTTGPLQRRSQPQIEAPAPATGATRSKLGPLADSRLRFVTGIALALIIGFAPAHVVASMREESAFKVIDERVQVAQQLAETPDQYALLDKFRADQLSRKQGEQRNAALIGLAIWALVGGALAFVWFKKIPWERFE